MTRQPRQERDHYGKREGHAQVKDMGKKTKVWRSEEENSQREMFKEKLRNVALLEENFQSEVPKIPTTEKTKEGSQDRRAVQTGQLNPKRGKRFREGRGTGCKAIGVTKDCHRRHGKLNSAVGTKIQILRRDDHKEKGGFG